MVTTATRETSPSEVRMGTGYRDGWVLANGVRTHYYQAGDDGPAVVLLHGGAVGVSGEAGWREMMPVLAPHFRVFAPDQLSFGWTDRRPHAWPTLAHQSLVNHVADFIDALCLDEVLISGNSQGAYIAVKYAIDHPEKVSRMFLIGSGSISQAMGLRTPSTGGAQPAAPPSPQYDPSEGAVRHHMEEIIYNKATLTPELIRHRVAVANLPGARESRLAFMEAVARRRQSPDLQLQFNIKDTFPKLNIPAMFVWGNQDSFAPVELGHQLDEMLPNIDFRYIDECGHQCQNDRPDAVNPMILDYFHG